VFALGLSLTNAGYAMTITYKDFQHVGSDPIDYVVTVSDDPDGYFKITYMVDPASNYSVGKFTGFFFDVAPPFGENNSPYIRITVAILTCGMKRIPRAPRAVVRASTPTN
jgi:hypothetical protein